MAKRNVYPVHAQYNHACVRACPCTHSGFWADTRNKNRAVFLFTHLRSKLVMAEASMAEVPGRRFILDGDIVLLHCPDTSGVVYTKRFG